MEIALQTPYMLLLFLLLPPMVVLHFYFFEHNKKKAMKFSNFVAMKRVTGNTLITKNTGQLILRMFIVTLLILSSTGPVIWYDGPASDTDYIIALDSSASMLAEDLSPNRLEAAKLSVEKFITDLEASTEVGVVSFAGVSLIKQPLTEDLGQVISAIRGIEIQHAGGTDIGAALVTSTVLLSASDKAKTIILITDGSDTSGTFVEEGYEVGLTNAKENHVKVHAIGIGTGQAKIGYIEDSDLVATVDRDSLQEIAEVTGGHFYSGNSTAQIATAFNDIRTNITTNKLSYDPSFILLAAAFLFLFFEWGLLNTRFRALP